MILTYEYTKVKIRVVDCSRPNLPNGIPDSDTFRRIFEKVEPVELSKSLSAWLSYERREVCPEEIQKT